MKSELVFRRAVESDVQLYFEWANDPDVRKNSFHQEVIRYHDHCRWFAQKLDSKNSYLFVVESSGVPVAQIRIEIDDGTGNINYSVGKDYRGFGYGKAILAGIAEVIHREGAVCERLQGSIKEDNAPSVAVFKGAGFRQIEKNPECVVYEKVLNRS